MTRYSKTLPPDRATLAAAPVSLADLKAFVLAHPELNERRKRDIASAIASLAKYLNSPEAALSADGRILRPRVQALHPAQLGLSKKRLDNVKSEVRTALKLASTAFPGARVQRHGLSPDWQALRDRLPQASKYVPGLSRFLAFCSERGLSPDAIDDAVFEAFHAYLQEVSLAKDPRHPYRDACRWWNKAAADLPGWPQRTVTVPNFRAVPERLPLDAFPESFRADLAAYLERLRAPSLSDLRKASPAGRSKMGSKAYAAATVEGAKERLWAAASVLVRSGHCQPAAITGLASLCSPAAAEAILTHYWHKGGDKPSSHLKAIGIELLRVATIWVQSPDDELEGLRELLRSVAYEQSGLTVKNAQRLRQFDDERNVWLLLEAPATLRASAEANQVRRRQDAIDLMVAAAVAILLYAPVRLKNLASLSLTRHWQWPRQAGGPARLHFPAEEVKNRRALDYEVPAEAVEIVRAYVEQARGLWLTAADETLFPYTNHAERGYFSQLIRRRLRQVTGLEINAHLLRHIAAKLYLDRHPGHYETVRQLLGHANLKTTVTFYCGSERDAALRHYDETVLKMHESLRQSEQKRRRPATSKKADRKKAGRKKKVTS